ncbi:MAG: restriction endonuclease subunit S [Candidatus Kapaibacterium sp.]
MKADKRLRFVPKLRFPEFRDAPEWAVFRGDTLFNSIKNRSAEPGLPVLAITQEHGAIPRDLIDYHVSVTAESVASYKEVCKGDFIISLRSFQGGIEYSRYHGICSPAYVILRKKGDGDDHFFRHLFKTDRFIQQLASNIEGLRDGKMISYAQFSEQLIPVPKPAEQQKIADCLGSLDDLIAAEGRKLEALKQHKNGLMQQLFPQPGESVPRLRFPEFRDAGEWEEKRLGDLGTLVSGLTYSPTDVKNDGLLVLRSSNIQNGEITLDDCVYVRLDINGANLTQPDDILICVRNGSKSLIGKNAIVPKGMPVCTHGAFMTVFRASAPHFARVLLQTTAYMKQVAADLGATINSINGSQLLKYRFTIPKPTEQQRIAACLFSLDEVLTAQSRKLEGLKALNQGLLQQLFPSVEGNR